MSDFIQKANNTNGINNPNGHDQTPSGPVFSVNSIYVKDLSFEAPKSPHIFNEEWQPQLDFDLQMGSSTLDEKEGIHEVVLHITVTVKLKEEQLAFLIDVQQAGVFTIVGFEKEILKQILSTSCPTVLFPYARETVSNLVQRGGFPQLVLPPINFDAMYAQHLSSVSSSKESSEEISA